MVEMRRSTRSGGLSNALLPPHQGSEANYEEMRDGVHVTFLDVKLSQ